MLSGPPASLAASISAWHVSLERCRSGSTIASSRSGGTTPDRPSEQSSRRSPALTSISATSTSRIVAAGQRARDDVAPRMAARVVLGQHAGAHLLADPGVVLRDLVQRAVAPQVDAAVADVRHHRRSLGRTAPPPRSSPCRAACRSPSIAAAEPAVGEAERGLQAVAVEAERRDRTETARCVLTSASRVSLMNASMASTASCDATSPAAWPPMPSATMNRPRSVAGAVGVFVLLPAQTRMGRDRRGNASSWGVSRAAGCDARPASRVIARSSAMRARSASQSDDDRACASCSSARRFDGFGAGEVDVLGALGHLRQDRDAIGQRPRRSRRR